MKFYLSILSLFLTALLTAQSGQKEVSLAFTHKVNGEALVLGETTFPIWNGKMVKLKRAEFYLSGFSVTDANGVVSSFPDTYLLVRAQEAGRNIVVGNLSETPINQLSMFIGVDSFKNHEDPTLYPETHPLGLKDPSMHWGWAGGYRFMAIEGMVDNSGDGIPETDFEFHNLGDALYKQALISIAPAYNTENGVALPIELDYARLFDQFTMTGSLIVHGSAAKNISMMNNAVSKDFFKLLSPISGTEQQETEKWTLTRENAQWVVLAPNAPHSRVTLTNLAGKSVGQEQMDETGRAVINSSGLASGMYIITLHSTQKISSKTIWLY
ncbi:MAG: T9SS type A sorting domain-containing protein [Saprospiraceae bacterium]|jgi:hypothetical protein|nr:T9SS type A sorting domain-containing protein [Saprospiraceae bacterium]